MINVSTEYFESINSPMRKQTEFVVGIGVENTEMKGNSEYSDNGHMDYSDIDSLKNLLFANKIYTTSEANMYLLDGVHEIKPEITDYTFQGYVSSLASNSEGVFETPPVILIESEGSYNLSGFTLQFDRENNDYATDFDIEYYDIDGGLIKTSNIIDNTNVKYIEEGETNGVNTIKVTFKKTHNYSRRLRITELILGIYEEFRGNNDLSKNSIKTIEHTVEISPLMKEIPKNNFSFTIENENSAYNAENPTGVWKHIQKGQIVTLKYIQNLNNGEKESFLGGRFQLTDRPETENTDAKFEAISKLESLEVTYDEGKYYENGRSYYLLIEDVFKFCGLKDNEYEIDSDLMNMYTNVPLEKRSAKECIQLLCQACGKIAFEDVSGKIFIKENNSTIDEYALTLGQNYSYPKYKEEVSELKNIIITKYTLTVSDEVQELANSTFEITESGEIVIDYALSTNQSHTISGANIRNISFFGECCKINLEVAEPTQVAITIRGNRIEKTATNIVYKENEKGYDCELDFKMLSDKNVADRLHTIYKKYLGESKRYTIDYRGNPELRPNDIIQIDTRFAQGINAMILKSEFIWDNGAKGSLTLKNFNSSNNN